MQYIQFLSVSKNKGQYKNGEHSSTIAVVIYIYIHELILPLKNLTLFQLHLFRHNIGKSELSPSKTL